MKISLLCEQCSRSFDVFPSQASYKKFCGKKCYAAFRKTCTGEKAPFYGKTHNNKTRQLMSEQRKGKMGSLVGSYKDGTIRLQGYVMILFTQLPEEEQELFSPMRSRGPYVMEHRIVMARKLKRPLEKEEVVHHINGVRYDNREDNLEIYNVVEHKQEHWKILRRLTALQNENRELKKQLLKHGIQFHMSFPEKYVSK